MIITLHYWDPSWTIDYQYNFHHPGWTKYLVQEFIVHTHTVTKRKRGIVQKDAMDKSSSYPFTHILTDRYANVNRLRRFCIISDEEMDNECF